MSGNREVVVFNDNEGVADFAVQKWMDISSRSIANNGYFNVALSGGRAPVDFYEKLSTRKTLPWDKTHIFLADERFVPASDKDSNYGLIKEHLVNHINMPTQNIHPVLTRGITVERSAGNYEEDIRRFFHSGREGFPAFDLIMLGIGEDGHTASLFPGNRSLSEERRLVIPAVADKSPTERISLTLPVINNAGCIVFLVTGQSKARAVKEVLEDRDSTLPAAQVKPVGGVVYFVMDEGAASLLSDLDTAAHRFRFQS
jgi:6-phosphogluconolactonase